MKRAIWILPLAMCVVMSATAQKKKKGTPPPPPMADTVKKAPPAAPPKPSVAEKTKSSKKHVGLFTMFQDTATGSVQLYVRKDQLGKEYIYQSFSLAGPTSLGLNQSMHRANFVFKIQKAYDKIEFASQNTNFYYDSTNSVTKSANVDHLDAIFLAEKVVVEDSTGYLIAADGMLLGDKLDPVKPIFPPTLPPGAVFNLGNLNPAKSKYNRIRSYPDNTDVVVELAYDNPMPFNQGGRDITDARYNRVKIQHSFIAVPQNDFRGRRDDPRVGYFGSQVDNLTSISPTPYKDVINRWYLKKKDSYAAISEPVEPIVFWVENTTPVELRNIVKEAGEKWNEAFEKAGFRNAVVMKIMPDTATWDPADIRYNVIRWVSSANPPYGAIGPSFTNPRTGQILGSDITVEWRSGAGIPVQNEIFGDGPLTFDAHNHQADMMAMLSPKNKSHWATCAMAQELALQFTAGVTAVELLEDEDKAPSEISEMHKQFLYYLILHEMGHTLGLNHNMKASQMLSPSEVHNTAITHKLGLQGSVMDYPAINVNSDRSKQGDYYTTKVGPYDLWAIEYGYTPFDATNEEAGLKKILSRSTDPNLAFGNDADDMRGPGNGIDPRVMVNDMSNDMVAYAEDRFKLVNTMMGKIKTRYTLDDESFARLRSRYLALAGQRNQMSGAIANYIGGVYVDRSYPGQKEDVKPFTPVPKAYQKKAMALLSKYIFAPDAFAADVDVYPYLQMQRRGFNFFGNPEDPKPQSTVQSIQAGTLSRMLNPVTLSRINNSTLYGNTYSSAEVMSDLATAIFAADLKTNVNLFRQNLQTDFVRGAAGIATGAPNSGYDNASRAAALATIKKIKAQLAGAVSADEATKAHRANLIFMIDKALETK